MIKAWSPSKLEKYEQCPLKCKLETIDKLCTSCFAGKLSGWEVVTCSKCGRTVEQAPPLARGTMLHSEAENYITGRRGQDEMHQDLEPVKTWLAAYRLGYKKNLVRVEQEIAVDVHWNQVEWFSPKAWLRTKIDVQDMRKKTTWEVVDWKTGKYKPDGEYSDQLNIYATAVLSVFEQPKVVMSKLIFIDAGKDVVRPEGKVTRKVLAEAQARWEARVKPMFADETFVARPGGYCRWCPYSKNKGGPCEY